MDSNYDAVKNRVKVVVIDENGTPHPDPVKAKKNVDIVIWVAVQGQLDISFQPGSSPFPSPLVCAGSFCGLLLPPNGAPGEYTYTVSVTLEGSTQTADPKLEVVP